MTRLRHAFRGSKVNRDRRDDAFARSVFAEALRRKLADDSSGVQQTAINLADEHRERKSLLDEAQEALDGAACEHCGKLTCLGDCPQYYEAMQDQTETEDDADE